MTLILKKQYFMLLEVLIAMGLTMILLSTLMAFYLEVNRVNAALEKEQEASFKKLYLTTRLAAVLPKIISPNHPNKDFIFYSSLANDSYSKVGSQYLTFCFNNGIKLDPIFSNHALGRLYLSPNNELCLAVWPSPARWNDFNFPPIRQEILYTGVEQLSFAFFVPPYKNRKAILSNNKVKGSYKENELLKLDPLGEWKNEWQQAYDDLPVLVKVTLKMNDGTSDAISITYPLPESRLIIVYE